MSIYSMHITLPDCEKIVKVCMNHVGELQRTDINKEVAARTSPGN